MLELDMGVQGAKRSRYYPDSPDALLRKLVEKNPEATETELEALFEDHALKYGGQVLSAIIAYWFANRYRALVRELIPVVERREKKAIQEKRTREQVDIIKKAAVAKIARTLLDKIAPVSGKQVQSMTKQDCLREGGWFMRLATKLRGNQTVGQTKITDDDLWKLYNQG